MKLAASIFSWLGGIATSILGFILMMQGYTAPYQQCTYNYSSCSTVYRHFAYPVWAWVLWIIFVIIRLVILLWRQFSVENGNKIGCGVCTLLFASLIGGILTLCIPEDQLNDYAPATKDYDYSNKSSSLNSRNNKSVSEYEKVELINKYKKLLDDGVITEEEFQDKKNELLNK